MIQTRYKQIHIERKIVIILAHKYGQLGNRLSYLKEFIALALEYDIKLIILSFDEYAGFFSGTSQGLFCTYPKGKGNSHSKRLLSIYMLHFFRGIGNLVNIFTTISLPFLPKPDENGCHIFEGIHIELLKNKKMEMYLSGWPCVPTEIIEKHSLKIREYFSLVDEYAAIVNRFIAFVRTRGDFLVGIHIRQGDYKEWNGGKCYLETDVYVQMMRKIQEKHRGKKVVFIVCSNVKQNWSMFDEFICVAGPGDAVIDMYSLAECDEIYGPQSSFSAWASFYGKVPFFNIQDLN